MGKQMGMTQVNINNIDSIFVEKVCSTREFLKNYEISKKCYSHAKFCTVLKICLINFQSRTYHKNRWRIKTLNECLI